MQIRNYGYSNSVFKITECDYPQLHINKHDAIAILNIKYVCISMIVPSFNRGTRRSVHQDEILVGIGIAFNLQLLSRIKRFNWCPDDTIAEALWRVPRGHNGRMAAGSHLEVTGEELFTKVMESFIVSFCCLFLKYASVEVFQRG